MEHLIFLGLGANLGDRLANLREGLRRLRTEVDVIAVSALYETDPVGVTDQPAFLNAACSAHTRLSPEALLDRAKQIERALGRRPGRRWGPRSLDIDLLLYDDQIVDTPNLQIPHQRLAERGFVLQPLADLDAGRIVPGRAVAVCDLLDQVGTAGVRRISSPGWERSEDGQL